jgi:glutamate synthase domain-containing protein 1
MIPQQQIIDNIPQLALQHALENQIDEISGSAIYSVSEAWQKAELQKHSAVAIVTDAQALEQAVASPEFEFIYIPAIADVTQGITRSILQRNPLNKRILWEARDE